MPLSGNAINLSKLTFFFPFVLGQGAYGSDGAVGKEGGSSYGIFGSSGGAGNGGRGGNGGNGGRGADFIGFSVDELIRLNKEMN